jgi:hypothetical protein
MSKQKKKMQQTIMKKIEKAQNFCKKEKKKRNNKQHLQRKLKKS